MGKREDILRAAAEEFAERGYAATSYATIGARVGMHRNALQFYAPSKPELAATVAWHPVRQGRFLGEADDASPGTAGILHIIRYAADQYVADVFPRASMRLMEQRHLIPAELPVPFEPWLTPIADLIRQAMHTGELRADTDPDELAWSIVSSFAGNRLVCEMLDRLPELPERSIRSVRDLLAAHA